MQIDLHCCGGRRWHDGYATWNSAEAWKSGKSKEEGGMDGKVPASCCHDREDKDCGTINKKRNQDFYTEGCMEVLQERLHSDMEPMMLAT